MVAKRLLFLTLLLSIAVPASKLYADPRPEVVSFCLGLDWDGVCRRWIPYGGTLGGRYLPDFEVTDEACRDGGADCKVYVIKGLTERQPTPATRVSIAANCVRRTANFRYWDPQHNEFFRATRVSNQYYWYTFNATNYFTGAPTYEAGEPVWRFSCLQPMRQYCYLAWVDGGPETIVQCTPRWQGKQLEIWLDRRP